MILSEVFVRFYKSFNYDFLRKNHEAAKPRPWETVAGKWYPYVRVPIEPDTTTIVGANESGKSHLLSAIEKGISGVGINREDFCRYSTFYTVAAGQRRWSDFGFKWTALSDEEHAAIAAASGISGAESFDHFYLFRDNKELSAFIPQKGNLVPVSLSDDGVQTIEKLLPKPFRINADVALPSSVPIRWLANEKVDADAASVGFFGRTERVGLLDALFSARQQWATTDSIKQYAEPLAAAFAPFRSSGTNADSRRQAEFALAKDLICKVAGIDPDALRELQRAIGQELDGHVSGIVEEINKTLDTVLNFPHWWVQDRTFSLRVSAREHELVFTIRDRTQTEYSFNERSSGLKYFLSYYIQYLAHTPPSDGRREILLMDEPDAYLSSQAQQDLLKVFDAFASPSDKNRAPMQVLYVTHSPFLIDKNHSERIRVLEKGAGDEGTRVVRNPSRNHYEPLRSALGAFVAETTFIGNCNLIVEGAADQVLLAGASTLLMAMGATEYHRLDLNRITIVPAGSASHVPYLVYLARGRDYEKPAVIVLLDSDEDGDRAKTQLLGPGPLRRLRLPAHLVLQVNDVVAALGAVPSEAQTAVDVEDLIPVAISLRAVNEYFLEIGMSPAPDLSTLTREAVMGRQAPGQSAFDALCAACRDIDPTLHVDKIGFARAVNRVTAEIARLESPPPEFDEFIRSMKCLFEHLTKMQRAALRELSQDRLSQRIARSKKAFSQDHPTGARKEEALEWFQEVENALDDTPESDIMRRKFEELRRTFKLSDEASQSIERYSDFLEQIDAIRYADLLAADAAGRVESGAQAVNTAPTVTASKDSNRSPDAEG